MEEGAAGERAREARDIRKQETGKKGLRNHIEGLELYSETMGSIEVLRLYIGT